MDAMNCSIPSKSIPINSATPWINRDIRTDIAKREHMFRKAKRSNSQDHLSPGLPVKSGVPQGSVLGHLFFLSYINDLSSLTFSSGTNILMFADDIVLYKSISSQRDSSDFQGDVDLVG